MIHQHTGSIEHVGLLLGTTRAQQDGLLGNTMTHTQHRLQQRRIGIVTDTTHLACRRHIDTQHGVGLLQAVERELRGLDAHIVEVEEVLRGLFYGQPQHHLRGKVDEVEFQNFRHKGERT